MRDTEWFAQCGWGVFFHYLTPAETTADDWNRRVDGFDVGGLSEQLRAMRASYFLITLGQGSGHYCAPNATYDSIAGIRPSKCSQRDLVSDLYEALHPLGIELLVYVPADGPWADHEAREGLRLTTHWNDGPVPHTPPDPQWTKYYLPEFQRNWEDVCRDWSLRFGSKIRGWWVDGSYGREYRYPEDAPPNLRTYAAALRAGNPDALVGLNSGIHAVIHYSDHEDFTAGEVSDALPQCKGPFVESPTGHRARYHILSYLGQSWCAGEPRLPDELVVGYTKHVVSNRGVITWDVPNEPSGLIPRAYVKQLEAIGEGLHRG